MRFFLIFGSLNDKKIIIFAALKNILNKISGIYEKHVSQNMAFLCLDVDSVRRLFIYPFPERRSI